MTESVAGQTKKILVARDDDAAFIARETEMGRVVLRLADWPRLSLLRRFPRGAGH
jgi:hypothetical protein